MALLISGVAQADEFYRWVDDRGATHFSESYYGVPEKYRDQVRGAPENFEDGAGVSVVDGLDSRWVDDDPNAKAAAEAPDTSGLATRLGDLDVEKWEDVGSAMRAALFFGVLASLALGLFLGAWMLRLACRWCTEEEPSIAKAAGVLVVQSVACGAANMTLAIAIGSAGPSIAFAALSFAGGFATNVAILRGMHCETLGSAILVQMTVILIGLVAGGVLGVLAWLVGGAAMLGLMAG